MALQTTTNINVDFYDKKYTLIKAKQYDDRSRWLTITCYNQGNLFQLNSDQHTVYIRYKKPDGYGVVNACRINYKGEVLVELTEQMLSTEGMCYVDLVVVTKGTAIIDIDTGDIMTIDGSSLLSTMAFCINVYESALENSVIESTYEFDAFNEALKKAEADYTEVIQLARSYAIGDAQNVRENENLDNSKYYSKLSQSYAIGNLKGSTGTKDRQNEGVDNAEYYSRLAKSYTMGDAKGATGTRSGEATDNAQYYFTKSKSYAVGGTGLGERADTENVDNAEYYCRLAKSYTMGSAEGDTGTRDDEATNNAKTYMQLSYDHATTSKRYAVGDTGIDGEATDNAKYYSQLSKSYAEGNSNSGRDNENSENAKSYMDNAYHYAEVSQRYAVGDADIEGSTTDNAQYYYQMARSYTKGDINVRDGESKDNSEYYYKLAKSFTVGNTGLTDRADEDKDNAQYYYQLSKNEADKTFENATAAQSYMNTAQTYMDDAETYKNNAQTYMNNAQKYMTDASIKASEAAANAKTIANSVQSAKNSEEEAIDSAVDAKNSAQAAEQSEARAQVHYTNTNTLYTQVKSIATDLNGAFTPMGTIEFAELASIKENGGIKAGYLYHISNAFTSDDTFKRAGVAHEAGTNVYYTGDNMWDCLIHPYIATIDETKNYLGI